MINKPQIICHVEKPVQYTLHNSCWIPSSAKFAVLGGTPSGSGVLQIYEVQSGDIKLLQEDYKNKPLKCCTFGASSLKCREIATGDYEGKLHIWDLEDIRKANYSAIAHKSGIMCIDGVGGNSLGFGAPEIVTGGNDGTVKVWDPRQVGKPVALMESENGINRECWTVAFGNSYNSEERVVCAGYDNGDIKLFDLKTMSVRWETNVKNGVCCLEFDRKEIKMNKLLATTLESSFHVFKMRDYEDDYPHLIEKCGTGTAWLGRHLPQNRDIFAVCSGAGLIHIWKYNYFNSDKDTTLQNNTGSTSYFSRLNNDKGSVQLLQNSTVSAQVTSSFNWCPDKIGLAIHTSFDQTIRVIIVTKLHLS